MRSSTSLGAYGWATVLGLWLVGCGGGGGGGTEGNTGDSSSGTSTTSTTVTSTGPITTSADTTAGPETSSGTTMGSSTTDASSSGSTSGSSTSSSGGGGGFVCPPGGGEPCTAPGDCVSNACYVVGPLGGVCSECDEDADCAMGCNPGNPLSGDCALCCDGSIGCSCETDLACQAGLSCAPLINVPGILSTSGCSECLSDADCPAGMLCSPTYDREGFLGHYECVAPGSKAIDEGCSLSGSGDAQCASGQCAAAAIMGIPVIAVCAPCNEAADCPGGACMLPEVMINGNMLNVVSGMCV